jgi:L-aspartate oxidase
MDDTCRTYTQALIIGSGIAGCVAALSLADAGCEVCLVNAGEGLDGGNSELAQGGIVYKPTGGDDAAALERDILAAGHSHNYVKAVRLLCREGPRAVEEILLERARVPFERLGDGGLCRTREGGHSAARILFCADYTGRAIMDALKKVVAACPAIRVLTGRTAVDLLTSRHHARERTYRYHIRNRCLGAYVLNEETGNIETLFAQQTILASGGIGQIYLHTTNGSGVVGSGISMASRAGVVLCNLEFVQFHPTALYHRWSPNRPLITEALRGEGARLLDGKGRPFMSRYDERGDLAPRDVVAKAMLEEMLQSGEPCLYLDADPVKHDPERRFPTVFRSCAQIGVDMRREPIPVVPAAHYFCGGILCDRHGRTSLEGLYAVGECSCTGLHGANRLASTSLLEGIVWGRAAGEDAAGHIRARGRLPERLLGSVPDWEPTGDEQNDDPALIAQDWASIRHSMWNYVGISRTSARLRRAFEDLRDLSRHIHDFYRRTPLSKRLVDLFHGCQAAYVVTQSAMRNEKSLGCHNRLD